MAIAGRMEHTRHDGDTLIAKLRTRACDPAPAGPPWVAEHYGTEHASKCRYRGHDHPGQESKAAGPASRGTCAACCRRVALAAGHRKPASR